MAVRYDVWLKFKHGIDSPLKLDFTMFNDYPSPTLEQLRINPLAGEINIIFAEHDDEGEFLQLLDKFVANETKNNANKLVAADFDGLESHTGRVKLSHASGLKLRHLPLDRMSKLRPLNTHLFICRGKAK